MPVEQRASLASFLLHSLPDPDYDVSDEEVAERVRESKAGEVEMLSFEELREGVFSVRLTPDLERQIKDKVDSGRYNNASEVVRESLRLMVERDELRDRLRAEIQIGSEQLRRGEGVPVGSEEELQSLARAGR